MSNITVRNKENGGAPSRIEWEPARLMRDLLRWDPFREMAPAFPMAPAMDFAFAPAFEIRETRDAYVFKADMPGVEEKDLDITRTGNRLTIGGKREAEQEEKGDNYFARERSYGSFVRTFTLPEGIDVEHIQAELKGGVLTLVIPKTPEAQPKKIGLKGVFTKKS